MTRKDLRTYQPHPDRIMSINSIIALMLPAVCLLTSCTTNAKFSKQDLMLTKPYSKSDTMVYTNGSNADTIVFYAAKFDTVKFRNMEQGFYNSYSISINYTISPSSYHKFKEIDSSGSERMILISNSGSKSTKEFFFLGLLFDSDGVNDRLNTSTSTVNFKSENARYKKLNINEPIVSFEFNCSNGITSFVDDHGVKWTGKQMHE